MNLWQRLMRCLGAYEVRTCPWCWGEVLVRDGLPIHMGDVCRGWSRSHCARWLKTRTKGTAMSDRVDRLVAAVRDAVASQAESGDGRCKRAPGIALAHALHNFDAEGPSKQYGCLGCPMVDGKCPHCGNEVSP